MERYYLFICLLLFGREAGRDGFCFVFFFNFLVVRGGCCGEGEIWWRDIEKLQNLSFRLQCTLLKLYFKIGLGYLMSAIPFVILCLKD